MQSTWCVCRWALRKIWFLWKEYLKIQWWLIMFPIPNSWNLHSWSWSPIFCLFYFRVPHSKFLKLLLSMEWMGMGVGMIITSDEMDHSRKFPTKLSTSKLTKLTSWSPNFQVPPSLRPTLRPASCVTSPSNIATAESKTSVDSASAKATWSVQTRSFSSCGAIFFGFKSWQKWDNVVKICENMWKPPIWEWFIPSIYGENGI